MISENLKEVFEKLIPIYEDAIKECPEEDYDMWLYKKRLGDGICWASECLLGVDIYFEIMGIMESEGNFGLRWYFYPSRCPTYSKAIYCLQWRVDKMKELLNEEK